MNDPKNINDDANQDEPEVEAHGPRGLDVSEGPRGLDVPEVEAHGPRGLDIIEGPRGLDVTEGPRGS